MTIEIYNAAKTLREKIQYLEAKQNQIKSMSSRSCDDDFNTLRQLAFGCEDAIKTLENEFFEL